MASESITPKRWWIYTVNAKGQVNHERSVPGEYKSRAEQRVKELFAQGHTAAFFSETLIKDALY